MATVLWFSPHQDDETLTLGVGIRHHLEAGHECHVILCTDGSASGVREQLGMEVGPFVAARDDEFHRAARKLGIRPDNIHVSPLRATDGTLTAARADLIVSEALDEFGQDSWLKGLSQLALTGRSPDHVALGQGVLGYAGTHDVRLYVEPYLVAKIKAAYPSRTFSTEQCASTAAVLRACQEYQLIDGPAGMWGVGYRSVKAEFDPFMTNPLGYYHVP